MAGFARLSKAAKAGPALSAVEAEFVAPVIAIAVGCEGGILFHLGALQKAGGTRAQLDEVLAMAVQMGGGPSVMSAGRARAARDGLADWAGKGGLAPLLAFGQFTPQDIWGAKMGPEAQTSVIRRHRKGDAESWAEYSPCGVWRYSLTRVWDAAGARLCFVMLNPSTATEVHNDPTVERCERRARALGYGGFRVCNIFAFRATDPRLMRAAPDPVGPLNDAAIRAGADWAGRVICAWGTHGAHLGRGAAVERLLRETGAALFHLGLSRTGQPKHPLYIGYDVMPQPWG